MTVQTVTLRLPARTYRQAQQRTRVTHRSVEEELVAAVENGLSISDALTGIPHNIAEEMAQLAFLDNEHLWRAAQLVVPLDIANRVQELVTKQQAAGLTETEEQEARQLQHIANRVMLIRAEAAALLKRRGFDLTGLRQPVLVA